MNKVCMFCGGELLPSVKDLVRCKKCGLFRKKKVPSLQEMKKKGKGFMLSCCFNGKADLRVSKADKSLEVLEKYVLPGALYDVGAAAGFVMKAAINRGWKARGNEISETAIKWGKKNLSINVEYGVLEEVDFKDGEFDAVMFWNSLEHVLDPTVALEITKKMLRSGGCVYMEIPLKKSEEEAKRRYERGHASEFNEESLTSYIQKIGFSIVENNVREDKKHMILLARKNE